jgi:hypothetical protein
MYLQLSSVVFSDRSCNYHMRISCQQQNYREASHDRKLLSGPREKTGVVEENARLENRHNEERKEMGDGSDFGREDRQQKKHARTTDSNEPREQQCFEKRGRPRCPDRHREEFIAPGASSWF